MTNLLCIVSRPPYAGSHALELIEAAMVGAVFDIQVSILFRGQGSFCLLPDQHGALLGQRTLSSILQALPTYDIERLYVCAESMQHPLWQHARPCVSVQTLTTEEQTTLLATHSAVIGAST